jgi:hypothetical protein
MYHVTNPNAGGMLLPLLRLSACTFIQTTVTGNEPHTRSIHILDDDTLLTTFNLYRSAPLGEQELDDFTILQGGERERERWWHKLTRLPKMAIPYSGRGILSASVPHGTPVADMLVHSPSLPLIIDYVSDDRDIPAEDEDGISYALQHRDRVCGIRLQMPALHSEKLVMALDEEYPMPEYLISRL